MVIMYPQVIKVLLIKYLGTILIKGKLNIVYANIF